MEHGVCMSGKCGWQSVPASPQQQADMSKPLLSSSRSRRTYPDQHAPSSQPWHAYSMQLHITLQAGLHSQLTAQIRLLS